MHPLLKRQLKRQFGSPEAVPESLQEFFERINVDYEKGDADHALALHSLGEMSRELNERNETLRRERDAGSNSWRYRTMAVVSRRKT